MIIGMDFGTTNSGMATYDGQVVKILPLDPTNPNPNVIRTAIYVTNQQQINIGRSAVDEYFAQNVRRPIKLQKVWVGEIEVIADLVYFIQDIYVWTDVLSPGRLFLSMKTGLRDITYAGTVIGQFFYSLEDLIALYLTTTRLRAEKLLATDIDTVVLGRPVHFAFETDKDDIAQARLLTAAFKAGYKKVFFEYEPIAAAYSYEISLTKPQNVLVFDFGGGTLDITVARLGGDEREILATGGIPIAGDIFDKRISRARLPKHFGEGTVYGSREKPMPVPIWIYDVFADWQELINLQQPENMKILKEIETTSRNPREIHALRSLVSSNYGLKMFDQVERAKRQLSDKFGATIKLEGDDFSVFEMITRDSFESLIHKEIEQIETHLEETLQRSGLAPHEVEAVIRTGGSSEIPVFQEMLANKFGQEKLKAIDTFSSVTAGLGVIAHHIETGAVEKKGYTLEDATHKPTEERQQRVPSANLALIQRRLTATEKSSEVLSLEGTNRALILLNQPNQLFAGILPTPSTPLVDFGWQYPYPPHQVLMMPLDHQLLIVTSRYRFMLTTPRQLIEMQNMQLSIMDLFYFVADEQLFALADWTVMKQHPKMILVTSLGYARAYDLRVLIENIEGPVPYQFDRPPEGWPLALLGGNRDHMLVLGTDNGRAIRLSLRTLPNIGGSVLNRKEEQIISATVLVEIETPLLAITHDGYARLLTGEMIPDAGKLNTRGSSILSKRGMVSLIPYKQPLLGMTTQQIVTVDAGNLRPTPSTKSTKILKLDKHEALVGVVNIGGTK